MKHSIPDTVKTKLEYEQWGVDPRTKCHFLTAYEGLSPTIRVSKSNPPFKMHNLMVDYDSLFNDADDEKLLTAAYSEFLPRFRVKTFSGNLRLVWEYEAPVLLATVEQNKKFLSFISKVLKLSKWHGGLDTGALGDPFRYQHIGLDWKEINPGAVIPKSHLDLWLFEAGKGISLDPSGPKYAVPIEAVAEQVEIEFPGRWKGPFEPGKRGVRFWDPSADNETAAIVREDGMQCFTGGEPFVPWRKIFGNAFVEQFEADRITAILDKVAYDGNKFWILTDKDYWRESPKDDFSQHLRVSGFNPSKGKAFCSEVDRVEHEIKLRRRVERAMPHLFFPPGIVTYNGELRLNISKTRCLPPAAPEAAGPIPFSEGRRLFPFIYELMTTMFNPPTEIEQEQPQMEALLAWLAYFYKSAYYLKPCPGQLVILAGVGGKGKTLFVRGVCGTLMGGWADGADHLVDGTPWTDKLANSPIMTVEDQLGAGDARAHKRFSGLLKKYVANSSLSYNRKFAQTGDVPWFGRIMITCNLDAESLLILPDCDLTILDKLCLFKASDNKLDFPSREEIDKILARECPHFARFLLDWEIPKHLLSPEARFGVRSFHHKDLLDASRQQGMSGVVLELLHAFLKSYHEANPKVDIWEGTGVTLHSNLVAMNESAMRELSPRALATSLGNLAKNGYNLYKAKNLDTKLNIWHIGVDLFASKIPSAEVAL